MGIKLILIFIIRTKSNANKQRAKANTKSILSPDHNKNIKNSKKSTGIAPTNLFPSENVISEEENEKNAVEENHAGQVLQINEDNYEDSDSVAKSVLYKNNINGSLSSSDTPPK